jgi:putative hemolysin
MFDNTSNQNDGSSKRRITVKARDVSYCNPDDPLGKQILIRAIELVSGQPKLQRLYNDFRDQNPGDENFWAEAVERLGLNVALDTKELSSIPAAGPLIVVANHPYGVLDGIAMGYILSQVRSDFKFLAHAALGRAEPLRPYLIPIAFDGASSALRGNVASKRAAMRHLSDGGAMVIFPAGRVSTAPKILDRAVDADWKLFAGKLIAKSNATVVPVFFEGQNSWLFHLVSKFSETLREALILREVCRKIGADIYSYIGAPIENEPLSAFDDRREMLDFLRERVYGLDPSQVWDTGTPKVS